MKTLRILLVEDGEADARLVQELLEDTKLDDYEVTHVVRVSEALAHLKSERVNVVLLDLGLLDAQGIDAVVQVYVNAPEVPVIVMTGQDDKGLIARAVQEGAQDYLLKDHLNPQLLEHAIRFAIDRQRILVDQLTGSSDLRWVLIRRWMATLELKLDTLTRMVGELRDSLKP